MLSNFISVKRAVAKIVFMLGLGQVQILGLVQLFAEPEPQTSGPVQV